MGNLLYYAIVFLVVALVAAFLGFGGVAGTAMGGCQASVLGRHRSIRRIDGCWPHQATLASTGSTPRGAQRSGMHNMVMNQFMPAHHGFSSGLLSMKADSWFLT